MSARALLVAGLLTGAASALAAQREAPIVLLLSPSPRASALANAYVGGDGPDASFFNPANLGRKPGLLASIARFGSASTGAALAADTKLGSFAAIGVSAQWLDFGASGLPTTPGGLTTRGPAAAGSLAGAVTGAIVVEKLRFGVTAKYSEERLTAGRAGGASIDVGISREVGPVNLGLAVRNVGDNLTILGDRTRMPTDVTAGLTTTRLQIGTYFDLMATAAVTRLETGEVIPAGGAELIYEPVSGWTAKLRAGIRRTDPANPQIRPVTLGAALGLDRFSLDYAIEWYRGTGVVHRIGIRIE